MNLNKDRIFSDDYIESVDVEDDKIVVQAWGRYLDFSREDITVMYEAINKDQTIKDSLEQHNDKLRGEYKGFKIVECDKQCYKHAHMTGNIHLVNCISAGEKVYCE